MIAPRSPSHAILPCQWRMPRIGLLVAVESNRFRIFAEQSFQLVCRHELKPALCLGREQEHAQRKSEVHDARCQKGPELPVLHESGPALTKRVDLLLQEYHAPIERSNVIELAPRDHERPSHD